jgi:hypothetical protein
MSCRMVFWQVYGSEIMPSSSISGPSETLNPMVEKYRLFDFFYRNRMSGTNFNGSQVELNRHFPNSIMPPSSMFYIFYLGS